MCLPCRMVPSLCREPLTGGPNVLGMATLRALGSGFWFGQQTTLEGPWVSAGKGCFAGPQCRAQASKGFPKCFSKRCIASAHTITLSPLKRRSCADLADIHVSHFVLPFCGYMVQREKFTLSQHGGCLLLNISRDLSSRLILPDVAQKGNHNKQFWLLK